MSASRVDAVEEVERAALEDLNAALSPALVAALDARSRAVGTAYVSAFGALPASAIVANRAIGLGTRAAATRASVDAVVDLYASASIARYFVHVHPRAQPGEIERWLADRGLQAARAWMKFTRGRQAPPEVECGLEIRRARPADAEAFARLESDAFDLGAAASAWLAAMIERPGWHVFMSFAGEAPAGAGALYVKDGVGWIDWGATASAYRGRGSQSALLRRRILTALDLGCRTVATATGEEVPGDPQISYRNIVKMGFEPAYLRKNYAPPKQESRSRDLPD